MKPIGVFDSGIGGLTVVKELMRQLPAEDIVYLGDTAHLPYGAKSAPTIIRLTLRSLLFLLKQKVKLVIIACNTASSLALEQACRRFRIPIIGVIQPGACKAVNLTKTNTVGVIGTRATIKSKDYEKRIKEINPRIRVVSQACPLFVPLVEEGWLRQPEALSIARQYLSKLRRKNINMDTLILGCTHYPLLKPVLRQALGKDIKLVDSAREVVRQAVEIIDDYCLAAGSKSKGKYSFYVTDDAQSFSRQAMRFLGLRFLKAKQINNV